MKKFLSTFILILIPCSIFAKLANTNWLYPANRSNTRFTSDLFNIPRPALSLRGFDNTANDAFKYENSKKVDSILNTLSSNNYRK